MKVLVFVKMVLGVVGGYTGFVFGGYDTLMLVLLGLIVFDYLTGVLCAVIEKSVSSKIGFNGILKKLLILIVVCVSVLIEKVISVDTPIREIVIMFFIANESISVLENISLYIPLPKQLINILKSIKDGSSNE